MPFDIPDSFRLAATGNLYNLWLLNCKEITIYKEPIKNIIVSPQNPLFGYGDDTQSSNTEITYTPVSGIYSGQVLYPFKNRGGSSSFDNRIILESNSTYLKFQENAANYINNGEKTEKLEFDGKSWNIEPGEQIQTFLGLQFYYFEVKATN